MQVAISWSVITACHMLWPSPAITSQLKDCLPITEPDTVQLCRNRLQIQEPSQPGEAAEAPTRPQDRMPSHLLRQHCPHFLSGGLKHRVHQRKPQRQLVVAATKRQRNKLQRITAPAHSTSTSWCSTAQYSTAGSEVALPGQIPAEGARDLEVSGSVWRCLEVTELRGDGSAARTAT